MSSPLTWKEAIALATSSLEASGIPDAELCAELLAAFVIGGWKRSDVHPHLQSKMTDDESTKFSECIQRRVSHEPLQYITGETEFFGLRLYCSPDALIPRPDTEILVEEALQRSQNWERCHTQEFGRTKRGAFYPFS